MSSSSSRPLSTLRGPPKGETSDQVGQRLTRNMDALTTAQNSTNSALEARIAELETKLAALEVIVAAL